MRSALLKLSLSDDFTIARKLAECGEAHGFYESDGLVWVRMYEDWHETWRNWPRSLPTQDQYFSWHEATGLLEVLLVQSLPLPLLAIAYAIGAPGWVVAVNLILSLTRLGVLIGTARAYERRPWTYWFSPLLDLPVALRLITSALKRRQVWRGRVYMRRAGGTFEPSEQIRDLTDRSKSFGLATFVSMTLFEQITCQTMRLGARALAAGRVEMAATGLDHIPKDGPVLLVARHYHHLFDGVVLLSFNATSDPYLGDFGLGEKHLHPTFNDLATTMARWPVVLRSDAPQTCVTRDRRGGGRSSQPPPSDLSTQRAHVILSRFSLKVASSLCFRKVIPILTHTTRRKRDRKNFFRLSRFCNHRRCRRETSRS